MAYDKDIVPDNGRSEYAGTPSGGDKNPGSHIQPPAPDKPPLPGEQPDPRC